MLSRNSAEYISYLYVVSVWLKLIFGRQREREREREREKELQIVQLLGMLGI